MTKDEIRLKAENDLEFFINLVSPGEMMGLCHKEVIRWWEREDAKHHQLLLFPRDHGKSRYIAYRVAWHLTKNPTLRVLYISATSNLAEKQLGFIKSIFTSKIYQTYWPDHCNPEEGKRSKWTNTEIALDHPQRIAENIRDPSIFTAGLTTSITGMHCDIAVLDDVVVNENAYTEEGRRKVQGQYSLLASIEGAGAREWVVGTRYHPLDLYNSMMEMEEQIYDKDGVEIGSEKIYEIYQKTVEDQGDGTGEFLWPKAKRKDGKWFGFDIAELARKRGKYLDKTQFRAQYYNDPDDPDNQPIGYDQFQYYEKKHLTQENGQWFFRGRKLNLTASIDFAFSTRETADYTAIVVVGIDEDNNIYVLDIDRFKTDRIAVYFDHLLASINKWGYKRLVAEVSAGQAAIVKALKTDYFAAYGLPTKIIEVKPNRHEGTKQERMEAILQPRYDNAQVYHYKGGNTQTLEEELVTKNPPHDDIKDALANAIDNAVKPMTSGRKRGTDSRVVWNTRFGGRSH